MPRDCNLVFMALREAERAREKRRWPWTEITLTVGIAAGLLFFAWHAIS